MSMIKLYYIGVPVMMAAQTLIMIYMAAGIRTIARRRRRSGRKSGFGERTE